MIRRACFGIFWFGVLTIAIFVAGAGVAGGLEGARAAQPGEDFQQGFEHGYDAGAAAGERFRSRFGWVVVASAAVLATAGTVAGMLPGTRR